MTGNACTTISILPSADKCTRYLAGGTHVLHNKGRLLVRDRRNVLQSRIRHGLDLVARNDIQTTPDSVLDVDGFVGKLGNDALEERLGNATAKSHSSRDRKRTKLL